MVELADNVRAYLRETRLAVFGSSNRDGSPHITGLWYALRDDDTVLLNTVTTSRKVRNLRRDPRAAVCVIDHSPARHVTLIGTVTFDDQHVLEDLTLLAMRYAGEAGAGIAQNIAKVPHISLILTVDKVQTFGKI
jgi:PPOX class probable F420-dependent enzyme